MLSWYKKLRKNGYPRILSFTSAVYNCQYYDTYGIYLEEPNDSLIDLMLYFVLYWHHPKENFHAKTKRGS